MSDEMTVLPPRVGAGFSKPPITGSGSGPDRIDATEESLCWRGTRALLDAMLDSCLPVERLEFAKRMMATVPTQTPHASRMTVVWLQKILPRLDSQGTADRLAKAIGEINPNDPAAFRETLDLWGMFLDYHKPAA